MPFAIVEDSGIGSICFLQENNAGMEFHGVADFGIRFSDGTDIGIETVIPFGKTGIVGVFRGGDIDFDIEVADAG